MDSLFRIFRNLTRSDEDRYLSAACDLADLERRQRFIERSRSRGNLIINLNALR